MIQSDTLLGRGIYDIPEVGRLTKLHPQRVRSWFWPSHTQDRAPLFHGDYEPTDSRYAVSFLDLIDVWVAGRFRESGIEMKAVREAYATLQREFHTDHPFCLRNLYTDGRGIFIGAAGEVGDAKFAEVVSGQYFFDGIIESHLSKLDFDEETRLATRWHISQGVMLDPRVRLGKPVVASCGIATYVLAASYLANGEDAALVSEMFAVSDADVHDAVNFEAAYGEHRAT